MNIVNSDDFTILLDVFHKLSLQEFPERLWVAFANNLIAVLWEGATDAHCQLLQTINIKPHCIAFVKSPSDVMLDSQHVSDVSQIVNHSDNVWL